MTIPISPGIERHILEHLNTAVLLFDNKLALVYLNPAAEVLFEVSARHLLGQPAERLLSCADRCARERLRRALDSGHPFTERGIAILVSEGRIKTIDCTVLPVHHFDAETELLVEINQVDRQLRITREEQLLTQHQATQALLRGLAHEIRNPLGGLRGAAQLLECELTDATLREYTRIIIDEADRLKALVDRLLSPYRRLQLAPVNIHHVLEHVCALIQAESPDGPEIHRDYDLSIPDLMADQDCLIQAILNLARNAASFAGPQGVVQFKTRVRHQFTIRNRRHRLILEVQVRDNGPGIPDEIRDRIFYPLVSGRAGGTGLGLPIAQELINQHGGLIEYESRPGDTVFYVYLPLEPNP